MLQLVLRDSRQGTWVLELSAGMEKFIGPYPRVEGFETGEPLLIFRPTDQPA